MNDINALLPGILLSVLLLAVIASVPVSFILLRLYRGAVLRHMRAVSGQGGSATQNDSTPSSLWLGIPPLNVTTAYADTALDERSLDRRLARHAVLAPWRNAVVYTAGGLAFAAVMTAAFLFSTPQEPGALKVAFLLWSYLWPVVIMLWLTASSSRSQRWSVVAGYFGVFLLLSLMALAVSPDLRWWELPLFWAWEAGIPSLLLLAFLARPIRAVGPVVVTFLLIAAVGAQVVLSVLGASDAALRAWLEMGLWLGLDPSALLVTTLALGVVVFAGIGWFVVRWLSRGYEAKRLGEQLLTLDSVWLLFAILQSIYYVHRGFMWASMGLLAFVAFKLTTGAGFRLLRAIATPPPPRHLLLLRVFVQGKKSELFFDDLRLHWQHVGSIAMIAGPDLVTRAIEPHELLHFVSGKLARQFVIDAEDLDRRLAALDRFPDPDGRYRVNEFFCHDNTWQMTMRRLAALSDAVLMDLRGLTALNKGCLWEIGALVASVDLAKVVFLIDEETDRKLLQGTLQEQWAGGPGLVPLSTSATILRVDDNSWRQLYRLLRLLLGARVPPGHPSAISAGRAAGIAA